MESIIYTGKVCGAVASIVALIVLFSKLVRWVEMQKDQDLKIKNLEAKHDSDIKELKEELQLLTYSNLVVLKALQGDKTEVASVIDKIEKHLNEKAHK